MSFLKVSTVSQAYRKVVWSETAVANLAVPTAADVRRAVSACKRVGCQAELEVLERVFTAKVVR